MRHWTRNFAADAMEGVPEPKMSRNQKSKRALEDREAKLIENNKSSLVIRGSNCSQTVMQCLKELHSLKKPDSEFYSHKNDIRPFEDFTKLEFFGQKHDVSLFAFGNSNKKRPDNLIIGRLFDHKMLDMMELGVENFKSMQDFSTEKIFPPINSASKALARNTPPRIKNNLLFFESISSNVQNAV